MFEFFRKRKPVELPKYGLMKFYMDATDDDAWRSSVQVLLDVYETLLGEDVGEFWVNYGKTAKFSRARFEKILTTKSLDNIEEFTLTTQADTPAALTVSVGREVAAHPNLCNVMLVLPRAQDLSQVFADVAARLVAVGNVLYGYGRVLTTAFEPVSEVRIKKTFGGVSVKVESPDKTWWRPSSVHVDLLKGIFPLNLVSRRWLSLPEFSAAATEPRELGHALALVEFSDAELAQLQAAGQAMSPFVQR